MTFDHNLLHGVLSPRLDRQLGSPAIPLSLLNGPLPDDEYRRLRETFHRQDPGWWVGQV